MRILKATKPRIAKAIMSNITKALSEFKNVNATIISGIDEGIYGWITVNYLSHSFSNETLGALDWGGASSQITFELKEGLDKYEDHIRPINLINKNFSLFVRSDLCYGKYEALKRYLSMLVYSYYKRFGHIPEEIASPCHKAGRIYSNAELINTKMFTRPCTDIRDGMFLKMVKKVNFTVKGSGNFRKCQHLIISEAFNFERCTSIFKGHCINPKEIPLTLGRTYIAFSTYFYYLQSLNLLPSIPQPQEYLNTIKDICEKDNSIITTSPNSCFEGLFLHHLLTLGYHFDDWSKGVRFLRKIKNNEVGWTLGYIIHRSTVERDFFLLSFPLFAISMICLFLLLIIVIIYYLYSQCCSYSARTYRPLIAL
uniref:Ectonucleoside triphosphate diphosphohydrolase 1 [Octodon degus] n=2 Tax=Lepeophtheirus salmonis TaxID=72036 RepID=A0A0K2TW56_LEPSM